MTIALEINGQTYEYPEVGDVAWGPDATDWATAVTGGMLQKAGGLFQLLAETDFGSAYGLKGLYYKSRATTPSSTGVFRLGNNEAIGWKNAAGGADILLKVNSSDVLEFGGNPIITLALGTADYTLKMNSGGTAYEWGLLRNVNIDAAAAIAYSKLALTGSIVNADVSNSAAITYGKLSLTDGIVNADINSAAAIAYSKLNLATSIVNADVSASAAIAYSKLALTGSIVNADINASAAIAYSKLALTGSIVNADINASAAIAYSKLNLATSIVNADISASAAIAYSKLNLTGTIVNADLSATSNIAFSKLSSTTCTIDEDNMASNSDVRVPTQQSVKAYVDAQVISAAPDSPFYTQNYSITCSVAASALTIALKTKAGSDPSSGSPVSVAFRNTTASSGDYSVVSVTAATSIVVPSTATLGFVNGTEQTIYVYLLNNGGTGELLVTATEIDETIVHTSTTIDTASDSVTGKYSTTGRTSKAVRLLARLLSTQTTAGTWAAVPTTIALTGFGFPRTPTAMANAEATRLGYKTYQHNVDYNNGLGPDISLGSGGGTLTSVDFSSFIPYQMQDGTWRMRFAFTVTVSSTSRTTLTMTVVGVTTATSARQAIYGSADTSASVGKCTATENSGNFTVTTTSASATAYYYGGDVELASKPTWAY